MSLRDLVIASAQRTPHALAITGPEGCISYGELDVLANRFARLFAQLGVRQGDRVGIWLEKSICEVAAMQGILRLQAIYVPLDPLSPVARVCTILRDCEISLLVTTPTRAESVRSDGASLQHIAYCCLEDSLSGSGWRDLLAFPGTSIEGADPASDDMAYILYTSGSTGKPKGVCISQQNALAFIEWAVATLEASPGDRFANHAPFHFDLSVLDLYAAFSVGANVFLLPDGISYLPGSLVDFIRREALTIWYSVPSVLILMMEHGDWLKATPSSLRTLLFAGESFPIKHLRRLREHWPAVRFLHLYGPTETNVCTFYEVREIQPQQTQTIPIGRACSGDTVWARKGDGAIAGPHEEGELMVSGPTVMLGYWGQPAQGDQPYATGDLVYLREDGNYQYLGRRDHLVKVRGYRVEPGDIEAALQLHSLVHEAVVVVEGTGMQARLIAYLVTVEQNAPSLLEMKRHCAQLLPRYMIIDAIRILPQLPRTRNGKIDRLALVHYEMNASRRKTGEE